MPVGSHSILDKWKNVCQLLNVQGVMIIKQTEICIAELLVSECSPFEINTATENLKL
jgi:hypothetical protein